MADHNLTIAEQLERFRNPKKEVRVEPTKSVTPPSEAPAPDPIELEPVSSAAPATTPEAEEAYQAFLARQGAAPEGLGIDDPIPGVPEGTEPKPKVVDEKESTRGNDFADLGSNIFKAFDSIVEVPTGLLPAEFTTAVGELTRNFGNVGSAATDAIINTDEVKGRLEQNREATDMTRGILFDLVKGGMSIQEANDSLSETFKSRPTSTQIGAGIALDPLNLLAPVKGAVGALKGGRAATTALKGAAGAKEALELAIKQADEAVVTARSAGDDAAELFAAGNQNKLREDLATTTTRGAESVPKPDIIEQLGQNIKINDQNAGLARQFLQDNITPAFLDAYDDAPLMSIKRSFGSVDEEPLLAISTAGWQTRVEKLGFTFVRKDGFDNLYRIPGFGDVPSETTALSPLLKAIRDAPPPPSMASSPKKLPKAPPLPKPASTVPSPASVTPSPAATKPSLGSVVPSPGVVDAAASGAKPGFFPEAGHLPLTGPKPQNASDLSPLKASGKEIPLGTSTPTTMVENVAKNFDATLEPVVRDISNPVSYVPVGDNVLSQQQQMSDLLLSSANVPPELTIRQVGQGVGQEFYDDIKRVLDIRPPSTRGQITKLLHMSVSDWLNFSGTAAVEVFNVLKTVRSSIDLSMWLRQGGILSAGHPQVAIQEMGRSLKAVLSPEYVRREMAVLQADPDWIRLTTKKSISNPGGSNTPVRIFQEGAGIHGREEAYISNLLQNVPILGIPFRASERTFNFFLNNMRFKVAKQEINKAVARGNVLSDELVDNMNDLINKMSGVGSLGPAERAAPFLNIPFWSPRLFLSHPQTLFGLLNGQPAVRREVARNLVAFAALGFTVLGSLKLVYGDDMTIETNRKSSDFGKARIGDVRINIWGGAQSLIRYTSQIASGEGKAPEVNGEMYELDKTERVEKAIRSKFSPGMGTAYDYWTGEDFLGEPSPNPDLKAEAWNRMTPLIGPALKEAWEKEGLDAMLVTGVAETVGFGVNTFSLDDDLETAKPKSGSGGSPAPRNRFGSDGKLR